MTAVGIVGLRQHVRGRRSTQPSSIRAGGDSAADSERRRQDPNQALDERLRLTEHHTRLVARAWRSLQNHLLLAPERSASVPDSVSASCDLDSSTRLRPAPGRSVDGLRPDAGRRSIIQQGPFVNSFDQLVPIPDRPSWQPQAAWPMWADLRRPGCPVAAMRNARGPRWRSPDCVRRAVVRHRLETAPP